MENESFRSWGSNFIFCFLQHYLTVRSVSHELKQINQINNLTHEAKLNMMATRQETNKVKQEVQGAHTLRRRLTEPREQREERESEGQKGQMTRKGEKNQTHPHRHDWTIMKT